MARLAVAPAHAAVFNKTAKGDPSIQSVNVLGFAPDGVLLIGDGAGDCDVDSRVVGHAAAEDLLELMKQEILDADRRLQGEAS